MEKRRTHLRFALAAGLALPGLCAACVPALEGTRLESPRYVLAYQAPALSPSQIFSLEIAVCAKPGHPEPESLKVDARMPEHRHGMNYAPAVKRTGPGRWRAEGLMLHMPGRWELVFELRAAGESDRLASNLVLGLIEFKPHEIEKILSHGPWPPKLVRDSSNRVSGEPAAIAFGEKLFFEPRLSGPGSVLCATCHAPFRAFQDGKARGFGLQQGDRNTPSLVDARFQRWFGWDGGHDSLWAQSIRPLLDPREMAASAAHVARVVRAIFAADYEKAFGHPISANDEQVLADVGKALAAFQETLVSGRTPFDDFRDALARGDGERMQAYPLAAQRGLRIFVGKGNCSVCHFGPRFTNGEFADTGVPFFAAPGRVDAGRHAGLEKLRRDPFNLLGPYNDDASRANALATRQVEPRHRNFGEWRVPSLRGVASTAPYMHDGSLATLRDVVAFYSELNEERLHADGEKILRPLRLSGEVIEDLIAVVRSLSPRGDMSRSDVRAP
jgi:cytochrome c peroxidase